MPLGGSQPEPTQSDKLRDANPLDQSDEFNAFMLACRRGDLYKCHQCITRGVNINGRDSFDYTPLIIASLCGHYELVQLLLDSGANAERNTFQGERCIYSALNNRIRHLLLQYDFSKTSDPHVYWSTHISSLLTRTTPRTADITLTSGSRSFNLHKFLLASRTPFFREKLQAHPGTSSWDLAGTVPVEAVQIALQSIYLSDLAVDLVPQGSSVSEQHLMRGLDELSRQFELPRVWDGNTVKDMRLARQRFQDEEERALKQLGDFLQSKILGNKIVTDADRVHDIKWTYDNPAFADVLLRADESSNDGPAPPVGHSTTSDISKRPPRSALYPVHKAILIRSEYFETMFSGDFLEAHPAEHLRIITIDVSPIVLELILTFLYVDSPIIPLQHALDVLYAADMLLLDGLKTKAAQAITTLGNVFLADNTHRHSPSAKAEIEPINIYDVVHAAWDLRVRRLEEFAARYLAYRLEDYIHDADFHDLIRESAERIQKREETDTIELLDDIRHYLSERFRLRFHDTQWRHMMMEDDDEGIPGTPAASTENSVQGHLTTTTGGGAAAKDGFASDAIHHKLLLEKIDAMLEKLKLDA